MVYTASSIIHILSRGNFVGIRQIKQVIHTIKYFLKQNKIVIKMVVVLKTLSHGNVDSGFVFCVTDITRIGDYHIPTRAFLEIIRFFAERPTETRFNAVVYSETLNYQAHARLIGRILNPKSSSTEEFSAASANAVMDIAKPFEGGRKINIRIEDDGGKIRFGKYLIESGHFAFLVANVANGGFVGWGNNVPECAKETLASLNISEHKLYASLRK
jgi:hypothetical protein